MRSFAVECKGFDHAEYRASKAWLEAVIKAKHAHYLEHRAYDPRRVEEHDRAFARDLARLGGWAVNKSSTLGVTPAFIPLPPSGGLSHAGPASGPGRRETAPVPRPPARTVRQAMRALIRHARRRAPTTPP